MTNQTSKNQISKSHFVSALFHFYWIYEFDPSALWWPASPPNNCILSIQQNKTPIDLLVDRYIVRSKRWQRDQPSCAATPHCGRGICSAAAALPCRCFPAAPPCRSPRAWLRLCRGMRWKRTSCSWWWWRWGRGRPSRGMSQLSRWRTKRGWE